jgi:hypothetical protein
MLERLIGESVLENFVVGRRVTDRRQIRNADISVSLIADADKSATMEFRSRKSVF